jgi:hypothetical protein
MRRSGHQERTGECRDNERGLGSYADRRAVRLQRKWPCGGKIPEVWRFGEPRQVHRHGDDDNVRAADVFGPGSLQPPAPVIDLDGFGRFLGAGVSDLGREGRLI